MAVPTGGTQLGAARGSIVVETGQLAAARAAVQAFAAGSVASLGKVGPAAQSVSQGLFAAVNASIQLSNARAGIQTFAASSTVALNKVSAAAQGTSAQLNAAIAAAAKLSNTNYMIRNAPAPVFAKQGGGGMGGIAGALGFGGGVAGIAGGLGIATGVAGIVQAGKAAVAAEALATAYDRQGIAAANLAGSQKTLNELLQVYDKATGGIVSKAAALSNVTKLMAVGFGDDAKELEKFAVAIRGISIAMGANQDTVTQNLILELFTQRGMRLDQLGLQYDLVRQRADELQAADSNLTDQMAYQNAVLEQAIDRFGGLAKSGKGAATGMELAAKAFDDLNLKMGQAAQGPLNALGGAFSVFFNLLSARLDRETAKLEWYITQWQRLQHILGNTTFSPDFAGGSGISDRARGNAQRGVGGVAPTPVIEGEREAKLDWAQGVNDLNKRTHADIISAERDYGRQRADTVRSYQLGVIREAQDFGIARQRQEQDLLDSIADIREGAAQRESRMAQDLARTISDAQNDSAERIADAREDASERLVEMEEDYAKDRERAAEDHRDKLLSAAGRLDAIALLEERKRWSRESKDAKDAHDDQRSDLQEQLAERIEDENESLEKSTRQANEAHERQLTDARAADDERIEDMKDDLTKRQTQEDADRSLRLTRQAEDHTAQLTQMDAAQVDRIAQIKRHAAEERTQMDIEHEAELVRLKAADEAMQKRVAAREKALIDSYDRIHEAMAKGVKAIEDNVPRQIGKGPMMGFAAGGFVPRDMVARVHAGEFIMPRAMVDAARMGNTSNSRSISIAQGAVTVYGAAGQSEEMIGSIVEARLVRLLEAV